ncbi:zinc-binding dehydrogenase [bacterium]|nr:zinc-binding dehydrogenase [bacterium]
MKAVRIHAHGGPEVLRYEDAPVPQPGHGQVLVKVRACALNHLDIWNRIGARGWSLPMPHILGSDIAGEVAALGPGVSHIAEGMECFLHPGLPGGPSLERLRGDDNIAADYRILGQLVDGGNAEYVLAPADNVLPRPAGLSWEECAAFPLTFLTAWHMLGSRRAGLRAGESVLVIGAGSGVGAAAIQIARARGAAQIITTAGGPKKVKLAQGLGADAVIDHHERAGELHKAVYELTGGRGVDVVVEHVGAAVFMQCVKALRRGGRLVSCGTTTGGQFELDAQMMYAKHLTLMGSFMGSMSETLEYLPLLEKGLLRPVVDKVFPLSETAAAHERMEAGEHFGKIVLVP